MMQIVPHPTRPRNGFTLATDDGWVSAKSTFFSITSTVDPSRAKCFASQAQAYEWHTTLVAIQILQPWREEHIGILMIVPDGKGFSVKFNGRFVRQGTSTCHILRTVSFPWDRRIYFKRVQSAARWVKRAYVSASARYDADHEPTP